MMTRISPLACAFALVALCSACDTSRPPAAESSVAQPDSGFQYVADRFADLQVLRYQVPGFETLTAQQKELLYYLSEAALSGRDIIWDQNYRHNLRIRKVLERLVSDYQGDRNAEAYQQLLTYAKRVWFSNGIHHHYSTRKMMPAFSYDFFAEAVRSLPADQLPLQPGETVDDLLALLQPILFDPAVDVKRVNKDEGVDLISGSANNYYGEGLTQREVEGFYDRFIKKAEENAPSYGLNSRLVKEGNQLIEQQYRIGGLYSEAITHIVSWLEKAVEVAENDQQRQALTKLIAYYQTGDLRQFDEYNILWVADTASRIDVVNGFIEVYGDPLGYRGAYESVVSFKDLEATKRIKAIGDQAQWFEDHSPILEQHKKKQVQGISGKVITVVMEAGDAAPSTPIGINLPNARWIRQQYGSKSVSLGNIVEAYDHVSAAGSSLEAFAASPEEVQRAREYGILAGQLHTDMHEVIGHASGQVEPGVGTPQETLKNYASTLEEARADLVALYYLLDQKLVDIGVMPSLEVGKAEYDRYIRNGLMQQLNRLEPGENLEEDHMRNRQLVAGWAFEEGKADKVIERVERDGKTYFVVRNYERLRDIFGQELREIQRIISQGDAHAARALVERYGVKVDQALLVEVKERYASLNTAPYSGFIQPKLTPVTNAAGEITDVTISYPDDFVQQMLDYGRDYAFLPIVND
ncbi:dipeptidyl-peptidase-3 [Catalinimonas alkaloidigena]|uniref:Dipeptidyl-peptidase-3 n=1 Tax=Catalinimonas alkaloidigena TaxID=1075417 RepID=A0A1G8WNR2_9BACT|nr:dipeptidyl peptidase 3 [Catalinimonas alkaloidigena]SDJ79979.1 dipeptidyl-peptidase-3 [Catalinimonas alkaloidigena]